ncbi:hypothetical protein GGX14DRAFT_558039 [Mycena pura]|uniref:Uncharacterized protein n=1 Tax=Mycena pura TaxID=153505 RepID=A0AAD6YMJ7_9AGAR|nr:hypothetical protein GGX14DRAFT_558039 [Mycena pura]
MDSDPASNNESPRSFDKSGCGPVFESPCSRRGCNHIFTYSGTNPFVDLAAMVAMHRRHCVGVEREISASRRCPRTEWQAPASLVQQFAASKSERGERWRSSRSSFEDRDVGDMDYEDSWSDEESRLSPMDEGCHEAPNDVPASGVTRGRPGADGPLEAGRATVAIGDQRAPVAPGATAQGSTGTYQWQRVKKTARKESERKALLETDPWVLAVSATQVVCAGCRQTIRLDARSRYYPGLWEKHRDRCDGVRLMRAADDAAGRKRV